MGAHVSDRHFLYLDADLVKKQLGQVQQPIRDVTQRKTRSRTRWVGFRVLAKILGIGGEGTESTQEESEGTLEDTPERMFGRYHKHLQGERRLSTNSSDPLISGVYYELHGEIVSSGVFRTEKGLDLRYQLDEKYWGHPNEGIGIQLVLFGVGLRADSLRVMAIYQPVHGGAPPMPRPPGGFGRRVVLVGGAGLAAAGVGAWWGLRPRAPARTVYRIAGGPAEIFEDAEIKDLFAREGLTIQHTRFGSGELQFIDLARYDGVFPASAIMARYIQGIVGNRAQFPSFGSPMIVMSRDPVIEVLKDNGIAEKQGNIWVFHVMRYLDHVRDKKRWPIELFGNRRLLLRTTDPSTSNSAAMFIAVASYALNGNNTITDQKTVAEVLPRLRPCFADQGDLYTTSGFLRDAYLEGAGTVPIGWIYEDDVVDQLIAGGQKDIRYLYPTPNVLSEHYFIPISDHPDGARIGRMLQSDQRLVEIAQTKYGYRYGVQSTRNFSQMLAAKGIGVPDNATLDRLVLAEVPSTDILGSFIDALQPQRKSPA